MYGHTVKQEAADNLPGMNHCFPPRWPPTRAAASLLAILVSLVTLSACSAGDPTRPVAARADSFPGTIGVDQAIERLLAPPDGMVLIDMRTPEEFDSGHLEGATLLDFYEPEFADKLAELDRQTPYLIYCRSGNRSGQALTLMEELGFTDVADIGGGVLAWQAEGQSLATR
jgi:phage shock protein E